MNSRPSTRGAAMLEFAMALPFALTLFLGIADFSVYFWKQTAMEEIARTAASRIAAAQSPPEAQTLQSGLQRDSGRDRLSVQLSTRFACPLPTGAEQPATGTAQNCQGERTYLQISSQYPVEPILGPLRWLGYPSAVSTRHVIRLR